MMMVNPTGHHNGIRRSRFGLTEVLLIAAILAFGAFAMINEGHLSLGTLLAGFEEVIRG
jgi:hypothetical protein